MTKPPAFQWYAKDWLTDDKRTEMSLAQRGAYADLLSYQWVNGGIPAGLDGIARVLGVGVDEATEVWGGRLPECFPPCEDGRLRNPVLESYRVFLQEYHEAQAEAGRKGARSRWHGNPNGTPNGEAMATPLAEGCQPQWRNDGPSSASASSTSTTSPTATEDPLLSSGKNLPARRGRSHDEIKAHLTAVLESVQADRQHRLTKKEVRRVMVELVFAYWQAKTGHEKALLDPKRETRLRRHLEENQGNVHELLYAIDGWFLDPVFKKLVDEGRTLDQIQNIFTDRERVERLAGHCKGYRDDKAHEMATKYLGAMNGDSP